MNYVENDFLGLPLEQDLAIALRLPNDSDLAAPARRVEGSTIEAHFGALPAEPWQVYLARLLAPVKGELRALTQSLAGYSWLD